MKVFCRRHHHTIFICPSCKIFLITGGVNIVRLNCFFALPAAFRSPENCAKYIDVALPLTLCSLANDRFVGLVVKVSVSIRDFLESPHCIASCL